MAFNNGDLVMHRACGMRGIIGSVAHQEQRCACFVPGSDEGDPPDMTRREAAEAALAIWERNQKHPPGSGWVN
jgi:hypothetical protein